MVPLCVFISLYLCLRRFSGFRLSTFFHFHTSWQCQPPHSVTVLLGVCARVQVRVNGSERERQRRNGRVKSECVPFSCVCTYLIDSGSFGKCRQNVCEHWKLSCARIYRDAFRFDDVADSNAVAVVVVTHYLFYIPWIWVTTILEMN